MLVSEWVKVDISSNQISYYKKLGYEIPKIKNKWGRMSTPKDTKLMVKVEDLPKGSHTLVKILCDYCKENVVDRHYNEYIRSLKNSHIKKDCCNSPECKGLKYKETMLEKYGVTTNLKLEDTKQKIKKTNFKKYGTENPMQNEEIKNKTKQTRLQKYGVEHMLQSKESMEKLKNTTNERYGKDFYTQTDEFLVKTFETNIQKYGVKNVLQVKEIKNKQIQTNLERYNVEHPVQNPEIKEKMLQTLYRNGNQKCSKQQKYLYKIINKNTLSDCKLNYLVNNMFLDIAFPEEKIYIEYDGGFHNGKVICGIMTQKEFDNKEFKRSCLLRDFGWKEIRIISSEDLLPIDDKIIEIYDYAINYLNTGHRWIKFDINNNKIITSQFEFEYNYGELRRITEKDLEEVS